MLRSGAGAAALRQGLAGVVRVDGEGFRDFHAQYRAILASGRANRGVWFRAWPAAKDAVAAAKRTLLATARELRRDLTVSDSGSDVPRLLELLEGLKREGYEVSLCGIFAEPAEILGRGLAREVEVGKRYNRDPEKLRSAFSAFAPAIRVVNGRFRLVWNGHGQRPRVIREGDGGEQVDFRLEDALRGAERASVAGAQGADAEEVEARPEDLEYVMEGNRNVVLAYRRAAASHGFALRCRKDDSSLSCREHAFAGRVASRLFGEAHVDASRLVALAPADVEAIDAGIRDARPEKRRRKGGLDARPAGGTGRVLALRVANLMAAPWPELRGVVTVELKPKCGLVERPGLPSRFRLLQHHRLAAGEVARASGYDPVKLLSGEPRLVREALEAALVDPQNNLRVFVDGRLVLAQELALAAGGEPRGRLEEELRAAGVAGAEDLFGLLAAFLCDPACGLPERLRRVQCWAAGETAPLAKRLYDCLRSRLGDGADAALALPEHFELAAEGVEALRGDEAGIEAAAREMDALLERASTRPWGAEVEREVVRWLCRFCLGRTAHDVSILVNFARVPPERRADGELAALRFRPLGPAADRGRGLFVRSTVIDVDVKAASKIPEYAAQLNTYAAAYYDRHVPRGASDVVGGHAAAFQFEGEVVWKLDSQKIEQLFVVLFNNL